MLQTPSELDVVFYVFEGEFSPYKHEFDSGAPSRH